MPTHAHILTISGWMPTSDNKFTGHWSRRHRLKRVDQQQVAVEARLQGIPPATGKRRVSIVATSDQHSGRLPDPTNLLKSLLDALVRCRLLVDDSDDGCEVMPPQVRRGQERQTVIVLEDVEQ